MAPGAGTTQGSGAHPMPAQASHAPYAVMMFAEDFHNTQSQEVTKFIRSHFKTPSAPPYRLENISCRNNKTRIRERSRPAVWGDNYRRRENNMGRGFYTPCHKPYHDIGEVQLNSQRLILNTLSQYLPKELPLQSLTSRFGRRETKPAPLKAETIKTPIQDADDAPRERIDPEVDEKLRERALATAGYAYIQQRLDESEAVLKAERGGQIFDKCIKKIRDTKKEQGQYRNQSPGAFNAPAMDWSPGASPCSTPGPTLENNVEWEMRAQARRRRIWLGKLQCIMRIMNALHNIKSRDLRVRTPMSHDQVMHVYRDVMWERPAPVSQLKPTTVTRTRSQQQHTALEAATSPRLHSSADAVSPEYREQPLLTGLIKSSKPALPANKSSMSMQGKAVSDVMSPSPAPWKKLGYHANIRKGFRMERDNRMETWEDLMVASSPGPGKRSSVMPTLITLSQPATVAMRWHQHHIDHQKKQPYWMSQGVANDEKVKRPTQPSGTKPGSQGNVAEEPDAEAALHAIQQNFKKTQKKLAREALQDLERLDRDRQRVIKQKFQVITESPLFEQTLLHLKAARTHQGAPVISMDEDSEIKLSPWYMDLKASAEGVLGKYDPKVVSLFNSLSQFSLEDGKSIPNAKEKLCLLVMSMPASQLLTIEMQLAIVFVLEEILWAPPKALAQWLHHRKFPLIIEIDMQAAA